MITFQQVYDAFKAALTERLSGTLVQVDDFEAANLLLLDYLEQQTSVMIPGVQIQSDWNQANSASLDYIKHKPTILSDVRQAHATAIADTNCNLIWDATFLDTNYSYSLNGFDSHGNPVEIYLVSKIQSKLVIKTLVNATIMAIAKPHVPDGLPS